MLAKYWKKIGMLILIIACVFNIMNKLVHKLSLNKEMIYSATYMQETQEEQSSQEQFKINTKIQIIYEIKIKILQNEKYLKITLEKIDKICYYKKQSCY